MDSRCVQCVPEIAELQLRRLEQFLPNIGKYITHLLEDRLDTELVKAWRWRPYQKIIQDTSRPDRPNVSKILRTVSLVSRS